MAFESEDLMIDVFPARGLFLNERCTCQISPGQKPPGHKSPDPKPPGPPPPPPPKNPPPQNPGKKSAGRTDLALLREQLRASLA